VYAKPATLTLKRFKVSDQELKAYVSRFRMQRQPDVTLQFREQTVEM
jgi:hypothetical protein